MQQLLIFLFLFCFNLSFAQDFISQITHYDLEDGLSHNQVKWIHKDNNGLVWIGAVNGINRFDGKEFKLIAEMDFFYAHNENIIEDDAGDLWLREAKPKQELSFFNVQTSSIKTFEEKFGAKAPFSKYNYARGLCLSDQNIAIGTDDGRLIIYNEDQSFETILSQKNQIVEPLVLLDDGRFWVMSTQNIKTKKGSDLNTQLILFDRNRNIERTVEIKNIIGDLKGKSEQGLLLYTKDALYEISVEGTIRKLDTPIGVKFLKGRVFYDVDYNLFWTAFDKNLITFNKDLSYVNNFSEVYSDLRVVDYNWALLNEDHSLWLGTISGLFKLQLKINPFQQLLSKKGNGIMKDDFIGVRQICADEHNNLYVNIQDQTLQLLNEHEIKIVDEGKVKQAMAYFNNSGLWTGSDYKLINLNAQDTRIINFQENTPGIGKYIWSITQDINNRIWLGTEAGLYFLDQNSSTIQAFDGYNEFESVAKINNYFFYPEGDGNYWMCTINGLFLLDIEKGITERYWSGGADTYFLPSKDFRHLHRDEAGVFWIASSNGLIRWDKKNNKSRLFTTEDGLSHNHIMAIYEDDYGFLWLSSDNGIMQFEKKTFRVKKFFPSDGITHREFNRIAHYQAIDGTIYFGGLNGVTSFHPRDFYRNFAIQPDIPIALLECQLYSAKNNQQENKIPEFQESGKITMAHNDRYLHLQFAMLDYWNSEAIEYSYTIEQKGKEIQNNWTTLRDNAIQIGALPYGDYVIHIKGKTANGLCSKQVLSIPIQVLKPFYLQSWFLVLVVTSLITLMLIVQKTRTRLLLKRQNELETTVAERTKTILAQAEKLKVLDKTKSRFLANISHEFRTPLTLILNTLRHNVDDPEEQITFSKTDVHIMDRNTKRLQQLIEQLLHLTVLESGKIQLVERVADFKDYLKNLTYSFLPIAQKKSVQLSFFCDEGDYNLLFDRDKTDKIFYNLLSNAIKFTPEHGQISLSLEKENQTTIVKVTDTGIGIPQAQIHQIFDRFYQVKRSDEFAFEGTGIGLALVKELVELYNGNVVVNSEPNKQTTFTITLPLKSVKQHTAQIHVPSESELVFDGKESANPRHTEIGNDPLILLIEDNHDLRRQLRKSFENNYAILEAADGAQGMELAKNHIPDIIISDVMLPHKSGYEICRLLKIDERTNHIPIILLTAKAMHTEKIEGLMVGADAYLTKPYDPQELQLLVKNIFERVKHIQKVLSKKEPPVDLLQTPQHIFMLKINEIIEENLSNGLFGVEELSAKMELSRSQLFRKLKAISGESPINLIRKLRLHRAKELLRSGAGNATEVSYQVGFNNPNYFFKCFKNEFDITAGEWIRQHTTME